MTAVTATDIPSSDDTGHQEEPGMSKRIVVISASPRKGGNTDLLCDEFVRGAVESGNDVEKITSGTGG